MKELFSKYRNMPAQIKASQWYLICSFITKGIAFITTPIYTRMMSTSEFGRYNVFVSWYAIIIVFVTLKLSDGVYTQGLIKFDDRRDVFSSALQGLTLSLTIGWFAVYLLFKDFWNSLLHLTFSEMTAMFVTMWTVTVFNFWASEQRVLLRYKRLVISTLCVAIITPITTILIMRCSTDKVVTRIWVSAIISLLFYSWMFFAQIRRGKYFFSKEIWKYAIAFNLPLVPHYLSQTILHSADRIMIERMAGNSSSGIYSLAYSVSLIMLIFNTSLLNTLNPWIYERIKNKEYKRMESIAYPSLVFIALVNIALIAFAPEAVRLFAPAPYYEAIWIIPPVAMSVFFQFMYSLFADFEFYYEKPLYITIATMIGALLNVLLNYIFIRLFGYIAAGYTTLVCYIVYVFMHYFFMMKICKSTLNGAKPYQLKTLLLISVVFITIGFLYTLTYSNILIRYSLTLLLGVALFIKRNELIQYMKSFLSVRNKGE